MKAGNIGDIDNGAYVLLIRLPSSRRIKTGGLGEAIYREGAYAYIGRASRNLKARLKRHLGNRKTLRWHVDHLLNAGAKMDDILVFPGEAQNECRICATLAELPGASFPVKGFGSSDCECRSHLLYFGDGKEIRKRIVEKLEGDYPRMLNPLSPSR